MVKLPEFVDENYVSHWIDHLSNEDYHADRSAVSSTVLKRILKSPYHFYSHYLDQNESEDESSEALKYGTIFHKALLEPEEFQKTYIQIPVFKGTGSQAAKKDWYEALSKGAIPVTETELIKIQRMRDSVLRHPQGRGLLKQGKPEVSGYYRDPITGIKCRIRPDLLNLDLGILLDVKTSRSCLKDKFIRSILEYGYHTQSAMYLEGIQVISETKMKFTFYLVVESSEPYEVAIYRPDAEMIEHGRSLYRTALDKLAHCLINKSWAPYQSHGIEEISLPKWIMKENEK